MLLYRMCSAKYALDLTGDGVKRFGGRWTKKGLACIYLAEHPALALVELRAYLSIVALPKQVQLVTVFVPPDLSIAEITPNQLPIDWSLPLGSDGSKEIGSKWLTKGRTALLKVPSAYSPKSYSYLLNPQHPDMHRVNISSVETISV